MSEPQTVAQVLLKEAWAQYPAGTDMDAAVREQRELGNRVLAVDRETCRIRVA